MDILGKKIDFRSLVFLIFLLIVSNGMASAGVSDTTIYVDTMGSGNYTTIQDALDNAVPGSTIIVYPGTYNESVDITVEDLRILSYSGNPEDTIVRHQGSGHNFYINANNVSVSGFKITGKNSTGIYVSGASGVNIHSNKLSGVGCGVQMESSRNCTLANNIINDSYEHGFFLYSSGNCILANNTVSNTSSYSVYLLSSANCTLTNNKISDIGSEGIRISSSDYCVMSSNTLTNISEDGIYIISSDRCNLTENTVLNTDYEGIYLLYSNNCVLEGNQVSNTGHGLFLYYSSGCNFTDNIILDSDYGSYVFYSSYSILRNNTISNTDCGLCLMHSIGFDLTENTLSYSEDGIYLYNSSNCNLTRNSISNSYENGIYVYDSSGCNLSSNTISESVCGIYISSSINCILTGNTANSGRNGLRLSDIEDCTFTDNIMSGNWYNFELDYDYKDIDLDNATGNLIDTSNLVDGKPIYYLEKEKNPSIGRDAGVVYCINCGNVEIKDFILQNNTYGILLYNTSSNIQNNSINNTMYGVGIISSHDVKVSNSRFNNSMAGVMAQKTKDVTITNNIIQNYIIGVGDIDSENYTLTDNNILSSRGSYSLYNYANSDPVNAEESAPIKENSFTGPNLVQYVSLYGTGAYFTGSQNLILEDNIIDQSNRGIHLEGCHNSSLARNSVRNMLDTGIYAEESVGVQLLENTVQNVTGETQHYKAGNSSLVGRRLSYGYGIYFDYSQNISLVRNSLRDIRCAGIYSESSSDVDLLGNTVQNVTGSYILNKAGNSSPVSSPLVSVNRINGYGIYLYSLEGLKLKDNTVRNCYPVWAVYLIEPVNATVERNTLENCQGGLVAFSGENLSIRDSSATNCTSGGILVVNTEEGVGGDGYTVSGCTVEGSYLGLVVVGDGTFTGNNLSGNSYGLVLYDVNNSIICDNNLTGNSLAGIAFDPDISETISRIGLVRSMENPEGGNNIIYNNYFNNVNNTLINSDANNTWNTSKKAEENIIEGPYLGGNYWANPGGTGFSQNCTDSNKDGIADSAYEIKNGTVDHLPLTIIPSSTSHRSSINYVPSGGSSDIIGIDSAQKRVTAGRQATFSFNDPVSGILGLSFTPQQYSGNVIVRIEVLGNVSGEKPEGEIYRLMNILVGNEKFSSGSNINGASINFRVAKDWVEENNIDVSTIRINRFHNEKWNPIVTEMTHEDEEYYYFKGEISGFSKCAITGEKLRTKIITPAEQEENETITGQEQATRVKRRTPGFESSFAALGILASVFFARKRIMR